MSEINKERQKRIIVSENENMSQIDLDYDNVIWAEIVDFARRTNDYILSLNEQFLYNELKRDDRIRYHISNLIFSTVPIQGIEKPRAYKLIAFMLDKGIYFSWTQLYNFYQIKSEQEYQERYLSDDEFNWIDRFIEQLLTHLRLNDSSLIDSKTLLDLEKSRWNGRFMPFTERAQVVAEVSKADTLSRSGEDILRKMLK